MIKTIGKDVLFPGQKSEPAAKQDLAVGQNLMDILRENQERWAGMAANMTGVKQRIIIVNMGVII